MAAADSGKRFEPTIGVKQSQSFGHVYPSKVSIVRPSGKKKAMLSELHGDFSRLNS